MKAGAPAEQSGWAGEADRKPTAADNGPKKNPLVRAGSQSLFFSDSAEKVGGKYPQVFLFEVFDVLEKFFTRRRDFFFLQRWAEFLPTVVWEVRHVQFATRKETLNEQSDPPKRLHPPGDKLSGGRYRRRIDEPAHGSRRKE